MSFELYYTSARKGLKPGSSGFCTVGATEGMPTPMMARLESLSSFPSVCAAAPADSTCDLAVYAHWRLGSSGRAQSVLSRVAPSGLDDTRRLNTLAYHLVLDPAEQQPVGPAAMMRQPGVLTRDWTAEPRWLASRGVPEVKQAPSLACEAWEKITGDAGWAGIVAQACAARPTVPIYLLRGADQEMLPLLDEAIALLPAPSRWSVTFNTCFTKLPAGLSCLLRCVLMDTPAAKEILKCGAPGLLVDLTSQPGRAPETAAARAARAAVQIPIPGEPRDTLLSTDSESNA